MEVAADIVSNGSIGDSISSEWVLAGGPGDVVVVPDVQVTPAADEQPAGASFADAAPEAICEVPAASLALRVEAVMERQVVPVAAHGIDAVLSVLAPSSGERAPLCLVAVLDKSGSMDGEPLRLVAKTMNLMLEHLTERDQLGLVAYDTQVNVLAPMTWCSEAGRQLLASALKRLHAGTATNLSGGLLKGLELHRSAPQEVVNSGMKCVRIGNTYTRLSDEEADARPHFAERAPPPGVKRVHEWTMEVRFEDAEDLALVKKVTYILHRSFLKSTVDVTEGPCFRLKRHGWGNFLVKARILLHDGRTLELDHELMFDAEETFEATLLPLRLPTVLPQTLAYQGSLDIAGEHAVRSTFLLTDGVANCGIADTQPILKAARGMLGELGSRRSSLFTFGFGSDHSEELLQGLAEVGDGSYSFIGNEEQIGEAFGQALGGCLSTTHQNVQLTLALAPGVSVQNVHTDFKVDYGACDGQPTMDVAIGDLFAEERRDILVTLAVPEALAESCGRFEELGRLAARGFSVAAAGSELAQAAPLVVQRAQDPNGPCTPHVELHRCRCSTTAALRAARLAANRDDFREAKQILDRARSSLSVTDLAKQGDATILALIEDLTVCRDDLRDGQRFHAMGAKKMACMERSHAMQRCMAVDGTNDYSTSWTATMRNAFKTKTNT